MSSTITLTQDAIDSHLASLRAEILALCETRNAHFSATARLPPEVLSQIFECLLHLPLCTEEGNERNHFTWVKETTHICRAWRSIALATPQLWSYATLQPQRWAFEVLQRAKNTVLDLTFPSLSFYTRPGERSERDSELLKLALANPERIRSIDITFEGHKVTEGMALALSLLAVSPVLRQLERIRICSDWVSCHVSDSSFGQPEWTPRLRDLDLWNCAVNLKSSGFSGLRTLRLGANKHLPSACVPLKELLTALQQMRGLEVLVLQDVLSLDPVVDTTTSTQALELPLLREFSLKTDSASALELLRLIVAPRVGSVTIEDIELREIEDILSLYSLLRLSSTEESSCSLAVTRGRDESRIILEHLEARSTGNENENGPVKWLKISHIMTPLDTLWSHLPLHNLRSLSMNLIENDISDNSTTISNCLASLIDSPILQDLLLPFTSFIHFTSWKGPSIFPALRRLALNCYFRKPKNKMLLCLKDWLTLRREQGFEKLECLSTINCPQLRAAIIGMLKAQVSLFIHAKPARTQEPMD